MKNKLLKLNFGCYKRKLQGFVNVDINPEYADFVCDLNKYPLPWKDNSCDFVHCDHLLEYLKEPAEFLHEVHRITKPNSRIKLVMQHFSLAMTYAEMRKIRPGFSYFTLGHKYWNEEFYDKFKVVRKKLNFTADNYKFLNYIFNPIINLSPTFYERFLCYILPCSEIIFELEVRK